MSVILRDGTVSSQLAEVDAAGNLHVAVASAIPRTALGVFSVQSTSSSPSTLIAAGTGFTDITTLILVNTGTATIVTVTDGTTSYLFALAAGDGINLNFAATLPGATSATAWTISNSASQTVDASGVYVNN